MLLKEALNSFKSISSKNITKNKKKYFVFNIITKKYY